MSLPEISIKNPVFAWMLMIGLMLFGWIGFSRMGVSQLPDVDFPVITVSVTLEGAAPEIMESDVVDVLEDALMSIDGIREVKSTAKHEQASLTIEFDLERNIDVALQEVQTKVAQAQRRLPANIDPPTYQKTNPEDQPIMWIGLSAQGKTMREMVDYAEDYVKPYIQTVAGVGDVFLGGFQDRNFRVWVDSAELKRRELTVDDVIAAIENQHAEFPAGRIETREKEFNVRVKGEVTSEEAFGNILIAQRGGRPIYRPFRLREVARVEDGLSDVRRIARVNGDPALGLGIRKQRGANAVAVADGVRERLDQIQKNLKPGYKIGVNFDSTKYIKESVEELNFTLVLSAVLTSIVCWIFLGSLSSTLNVLLAIPTSILGTFLVLYFLGFTLNTFTLLGLSLAIGVVVDDAIMVLENITRHGEMRKKRWRAALDGAREISFAAMAATAAVIAIFLPVAFMSGVIGKFFFQFGVTISVAVALSLLEALTLTPMRCSQLLRTHENETALMRFSGRLFGWLRLKYSGLLGISLRFKWMTILVSITLFAASLLLIPKLRKEMIPAQDQGIFLVRLRAPIGSSIEYTDEKFKAAEKIVKKHPEVSRYFASIGGFGGGDVDTGVMFITMVDQKDRNVSQQQFMDKIREEFNALGGIRAIVQDLSARGFTADRGFPVEFSIRGENWEDLGRLSEEIQAEMEKSGSFQDVDSDYRLGMPEVEVVPDRAKAAMRDVSVATIGRAIQAAIGGVTVGKYSKGGHRYDIRLRLKEENRDSPENIRNLFVRNNRGEMIRLSEVTTVEQKVSLQSIRRRDRARSIGISANLSAGVSQADAMKKAEELSRKILPEGYDVVMTGGAKSFQDTFSSLMFALWLGVAVAYMVLGSQFNSFIHPFTILLALPFSITGGLLALLIGGQSLNIFSMIGLLLLMGLVKKNSILLVDFTNQVRKTGKSTRESLMEACPVRLRPILLTSFSTIAAATPPALALGPGAETRIPMAIVVIGGVLVSTAMTLFVVPSVYEVLSVFQKRDSELDS